MSLSRKTRPWTVALVTLVAHVSHTCRRCSIVPLFERRCSDARLPGSDSTIARNARRATSPDYPREESAPRGRPNRAGGSGGIQISSLIGERRRPTQFPAADASGFVKPARTRIDCDPAERYLARSEKESRFSRHSSACSCLIKPARE